jgi:hypothetical protein
MTPTWKRHTGDTVGTDSTAPGTESREPRRAHLIAIAGVALALVAVPAISCWRSDAATAPPSPPPPSSSLSSSVAATAGSKTVGDAKPRDSFAVPGDVGSLARDLAARARAQAAEGAGASGPASQPAVAARQQQYLGSFTETQVRLAAAGAESTGEPAAALQWRIADWAARPRSIAALSFRAAGTGGDPRSMRAHLVLLEDRAGALASVAEGRPALTKINCDSAAGDGALANESPPTFDLDLAHYLVAPGNAALGVRLTCHNSFPAGEGSETRLILFELRGHELREIFDQPIAWTNEDRAGGEATTARGVLVARGTKHGGHFDLALRMTIARGPLGGDQALAPKKKSATNVDTKRFTWTGQAYGPLMGK